MFQALYTASSGQFMFSRGLDVISSNLNNMQTTGYRGQDLLFQSITSQGGDAGIGARIAGQITNMQPGDTRQTGQALDLAVAGAGYFVVRDGDNFYYTRTGETLFDDDGFLVHKASGFRVQHLDEAGAMQDITLESFQFLPPQATTQVDFSGIITSTPPAPPAIPPTDPLGTPLTTKDIKYFNALGEEVLIKAEFRFKTVPAGTPPPTGVYTVTLKDKNGIVIGTSFDISFDPAGNMLPPNTHSVTIPGSVNGNAGASIDISLNFEKMRRQAGTSSVNAAIKDGRASQPLVSIAFNDKGELQLRYANDDTETHHRLALAFIRNENALSAVEGGVYETDASNIELGYAGEGRFGRVVPESLEASNVDMTEQFAKLILQQRGFQACARVLNVANEMLEELYGRG